MNESIWEIMQHGSGAMWVIVAFSVIAIAVAIERAIAQWKFVERARMVTDAVNRALGRGAIDEARSLCERSPSPIADVLLVGFERIGRGKLEHVATAVHRERVRVTGDLKTRMWMLGTVGATAPFVGLFGTVVGIMNAMGSFHDEAMKTSTVAGPISEALIVTAAGILVAVEAVILFNYFNQRAARIATEMKLLTDEFLENLGEVEGQAAAKVSKHEPKSEKASDGDR